MKKVLAVLIVLFAVAFSFVVCVTIGGLAIGAANSWIIGGNFSDGWSSAWDRKFITFGWMLLFFSLPAIRRS